LVVDQQPVRLILLDSLLYTNKVPGFLGRAQRDWLQKFLGASDECPTLIFVHHTLGDGDGELLDVERLLRIVRPQRKVKAIFYGHSHEYNFKEDEGLHLINLPAVGYNFADTEPVGWVDGIFTAKGAQLQLHAFGGNRSQDGSTKSLSWRA
jgi:3',5'-cyclic AMP phosphodiesterase CpdA